MVPGFPPLGMALQRSLEAERHVQQALSAEEEQNTNPSVPLDSVLQEPVAQTARQDHIVVEDRSPATVLLGTSAAGEHQNPIHGPHRVQLVAIAHMVLLQLYPVPQEPWERRAALYQEQSRPPTALVASQVGSVLSAGVEPSLALLVTTVPSLPQLRCHVLEALGPLRVSW
jgi:hypothetical protein